jgi:hypothetical protein
MRGSSSCCFLLVEFVIGVSEQTGSARLVDVEIPSSEKRKRTSRIQTGLVFLGALLFPA